MFRRSSGILLHVTSLPSPFGVGDMGPDAYRFVDFLQQAKQSYWQVLPLTPPRPGGSYSPYDCLSAFAGNPLLISPQLLVERGWLRRADLRELQLPSTARVDYRRAIALKQRMLDRAYDAFQPREYADYERFIDSHRDWLEDYALFAAIKQQREHQPWSKWPVPLRDRHPAALAATRESLAESISRLQFEQFVFFDQWHKLKQHCNDAGIQLFGDVPIYVAQESAEVWAHPELFKLKRNKTPRFVTGVPPDAFSDEGQLWGNPVYDWDRHEQDDFRWWIARLRHNLALFDLLRIDHFRGLVDYWQVPASARTAKRGSWVQGPGAKLFKAIGRHWPHPPLIAEDLGLITPEVRACMQQFNLPGMKVLLFAFDNVASNPYAPHNYERHAVVYTGTHDNNTARGWYQTEATAAQKSTLAKYLGRPVRANNVAWELVRSAHHSVADLAIVAMQDVLGLDGKARMNLPATTRNNWRWRLTRQQPRSGDARRLERLSALTGRT